MHEMPADQRNGLIMELSRKPAGNESPALPMEADPRWSGLLDHPAEAERQVLLKAAQWAVEAHQGQERASGEAFSRHALARL